MRIETTNVNPGWKIATSILGSGRGSSFNSWLILDGKIAFTAVDGEACSVELDLPEAVDHPMIIHAAQLREALKLDAKALQVEPYSGCLASINGVCPSVLYTNPRAWIEARRRALSRGHKKVGDLQIDTKVLAKIAPFMGVDDYRSWLNGVCIDRNSGRIVASDGSIMAITRPGAARVHLETSATLERNVLIRREAIKLLLKSGLGHLEVYMVLQETNDVTQQASIPTLVAPFSGGRLIVHAPNYSGDSYPDWRVFLAKANSDGSKAGYAEAVFQLEPRDLEKHVRDVKKAGSGSLIEMGVLVDALGYVASAEESPVAFRRPAAFLSRDKAFSVAMVDARYLLCAMKAIGGLTKWNVSSSEVWYSSASEMSVFVMPMRM